jgi:hypothetical protein
MTVRARVFLVRRKRKLDRDLVATGQVGVGDLGVGNLEGGPVLDVEGELRLAKLGLAPVPSPQGMLLVFQVRAVPVLEDLGEALIVLGQGQHAAHRGAMPHSGAAVGEAHLLQEPIELDDTRVALQNLDLVALGRPTPLGAPDVAVIEGEGVAAAGWFPAEAILGEPALSVLLGKIQVDVVEALADRRGGWLAWDEDKARLEVKNRGVRRQPEEKERGRYSHGGHDGGPMGGSSSTRSGRGLISERTRLKHGDLK